MDAVYTKNYDFRSLDLDISTNVRTRAFFDFLRGVATRITETLSSRGKTRSGTEITFL